MDKFCNSTNWLNKELKQDIKEVFEPKYQRSLSDSEIVEIAENLANLVEDCLKFKWRLNNEKSQS